MTVPADTAAATRPQVRLVLSAVFLAFLAQMTLNPIIAPLSREVGLAEWQVGLTISTAAIMVVSTSQFWGRRSQSLGRKPVLAAAFALAVTATGLFALVSWLGMAGALTGTLLFGLFLLLRGVGFGGALAAVAPTAQAYIADVTPDEAARVKGMAGVGAVQGVSMIAGAVVGGVLAAFGLIVPLVAVPLILVAALGFALLIPDLGLFGMFASMVVAGLGMGTAMPGYTAGPTLLVEREEQGGLAGLTSATTGLTFVVAPTAGTALYAIEPALPVIVATAILAVLAVFLHTHPRFREAPQG